MLFYMHGGDALWASLFWIFVMPILVGGIIAGILYMATGGKSFKSDDEKVNSLLFSLNEEDKGKSDLSDAN